MASIHSLTTANQLQMLQAARQVQQKARPVDPSAPSFAQQLQALSVSSDVEEEVVGAVQDAINSYEGSGDPAEMANVIQSAMEQALAENGVNVGAFRAQLDQSSQLLAASAGGASADLTAQVQGAVQQALAGYSGSGNPEEVRQVVQGAVDATLKANGISVESMKGAPGGASGFPAGTGASPDALAATLAMLGGGVNLDQYA